MRAVVNLMKLMEGDQIYFWTQRKATIKARAPWQMWADEPLSSNKQFQEGSVLATGVHEHQKERQFRNE